MRQPWFRDRDGWWYISYKFGGKTKQAKLSKDREEAFRLWRAMPDPKNPAWVRTVRELFERRQKSMAADGSLSVSSVEWYARMLKKFLAAMPRIECEAIRPHHVTEFIAEHSVSRQMQWGLITGLKATLNWGVKQGYIEKNWLKGMPRPRSRSRKHLIPDHVVERILANSDGAFRTYLIALKTLGCRPGTVRALTARHLSADGRSWVFEPYEHKAGNRTESPLVIRLTPCMSTLTKILAHAHPEGPLFRNSHGQPWKRYSIKDRFVRLRKKLGLPKGTVAYCFRHMFITRALLNGVSIATVAQLVGHKDTSMIAKHYGHLDQFSAHLDAAMLQANPIRKLPDA